MKTMIAMMNAMKFYKTAELVNGNMQEKLSQDINVPAYRKMVNKIQEKYFLRRA